MKKIIELLQQISASEIPNLLEKETYEIYKYIYMYKLSNFEFIVIDENIKKLLHESLNENIIEIEKIIICLLLGQEVLINDVRHKIFILEYFPQLNIRVKEKFDVIYRIVVEYFLLEKHLKKDTYVINTYLMTYINNLLKLKDKQLILKRNTVNNFLIFYNTKIRILNENQNTNFINFICKYLTNNNLCILYDLIEDKSQINIKINDRNLFHNLINKIIRDTLINTSALINLKIEKKSFYKQLNLCTMVHPNILDLNFKKYINILKIVKYKEKYILLIEWLKVFIYFGKYDLFVKLFKQLQNKKILLKEILVFKYLFIAILKANTTKILETNIFKIKCSTLVDSEFCVYKYSDILSRI